MGCSTNPPLTDMLHCYFLKELYHPLRMHELMKTKKRQPDFFMFSRRFKEADFICLNLSHHLLVSEVLY